MKCNHCVTIFLDIKQNIPEVYDQIGYKLTLQNEFKEYIKRLIIKLDRPVGRDIYTYAKGLTGDNKDFINIVKENGEDYIRNNFTYAILEIFDMKTKDDYIISREHHWMKVFQTKKFGMNN